MPWFWEKMCYLGPRFLKNSTCSSIVRVSVSFPTRHIPISLSFVSKARRKACLLRPLPHSFTGAIPVPELIPAERDAIAYLRSPVAIRERCQQVLELACADQLRHFAYHPDKLPEVATYVAEVTRDAYPTLDVPFHSRWRHLDLCRIARVPHLD